MVYIREASSADSSELLALNNSAVPAVNQLDGAALDALMVLADRVWVADDRGTPVALLVTMSPGVGYESANYRWLSDRFEDFGYVDRIVVAPSHQRRGLANDLYDTFADHAAARGSPRLLCEVNVDPPNPQSIAFHTSSGWAPIGDLLHQPGKAVRFFERLL